jgi:hypothetical protein
MYLEGFNSRGRAAEGLKVLGGGGAIDRTGFAIRQKKGWVGANAPLPPSSTGMKLLGKSFVNQLSGQTDFRFRINDQKQWGLLSKYLD